MVVITAIFCSSFHLIANDILWKTSSIQSLCHDSSCETKYTKGRGETLRVPEAFQITSRNKVAFNRHQQTWLNGLIFLRIVLMFWVLQSHYHRWYASYILRFVRWINCLVLSLIGIAETGIGNSVNISLILHIISQLYSK